LARLTVTAVDPDGLPASRAQANQRKPVRIMMATANLLMPVLKHLTSVMRSTTDAARDLVAVTVEPEFDRKRGYFVGRKPEICAEMSRDREAQGRLWAVCWKWTNLTPGETVLSDIGA
jgi:WW domain-containing oxidoreductase